MPHLFSFELLITFIIGFILGGSFFWVVVRDRLKTAQEVLVLREDNQIAGEEIASLQAILATEKRVFEEKLKAYESAEKRLSDTFSNLSNQALKGNMDSFFQMAKSTFDKLHSLSHNDLKERQGSINEMLTPFKERLKSMDEKLGDIEKSRITAYTSIHHQVKELMTAQEKLQAETSTLSKALRLPTVKGRWGEIQLRRLVELAGMLPHCDFVEQVHVETDSGERFRPDMIIYLPDDKQIILDSKVPIKAYLEAQEAVNDTEKTAALKMYAKNLRLHVKELSGKAYWQNFTKAPEFVILFLPADPFLSTALETDPALMEDAFSKNIIIATPATLMAILLSMAYGWQQATMAEKVQEIRILGQGFYQKFNILGEEMEKLGRQLRLGVSSYNKSIGVLNEKLHPLAKKLAENIGKDSKSVKKPNTIEAPTTQEKKESKRKSKKITLA